jgi:hypothetical protein
MHTPIMSRKLQKERNRVVILTPSPLAHFIGSGDLDRAGVFWEGFGDRERAFPRDTLRDSGIRRPGPKSGLSIILNSFEKLLGFPLHRGLGDVERCMRAFFGIGVVIGLAGATYWYLTAKKLEANQNKPKVWSRGESVKTQTSTHAGALTLVYISSVIRVRSIRLSAPHRGRVQMSSSCFSN